MNTAPYMPIAAAQDGTAYTSTNSFVLGNFACDNAGTITVQTITGNLSYLSAFPVTAGQVYQFDWAFGDGTLSVDGGATGTFGIRRP